MIRGCFKVTKSMEIEDVNKLHKNHIVHKQSPFRSININQKIDAKVLTEERISTARNHLQLTY